VRLEELEPESERVAPGLWDKLAVLAEQLGEEE
jgi:hypothetical protein